jgi:hypothetical protein
MRLLATIFFVLSAAVASAVAPLAPTNLQAEKLADGAIRLTWTAPSTTGGGIADSYRVLRVTTTPPTSQSFTPSPASATTYTDTTGALGTSYTYSVLASSGGEEGPPSNTVTVTPEDLPGVPANLRVTKVTGSTITLTWAAVNEDDVTYTVYRDGDAVEEDLTTTTFTDSGLTAETEYSYVVTANTIGGESADSNEVSATTFGDGTEKQAAFAKRFRQIDIDASGLLSLDEYIAGHGGRLAWVVVVHRFEYSDSDGSGDLSLAEYAKALGGRKFMSPSKPRQFYLADLDASGDLDPEEYPLIRGSRTKQAVLTKSFTKLDKDDSGGLSPLELKIRNYAPPADDL